MTPLLLPLLACLPTNAPVRVAPSLDVDARAGTVATVRWTSSAPGDAVVEVGPDDAYGRRIAGWSSDDGLEHAVVVAGLAGGSAWHWRAVTETDDGPEVSDDDVFSPPSAPADIPPFVTRVAEEPDDFALVTLLGATAAVALLDGEGRPVWWYVPDPGVVVSQARMSADGKDVLLLEGDAELAVDIGALVRVSLATGEATRTRLPMAHHDFLELPDGRIAYLRMDIRAWGGDDVAGDDVAVLDPATGEIETVWSAWDTLPTEEIDPGRVFYAGVVDWTHANALAFDPLREELWVSLHNLDALVVVALATGDVERRIGASRSDLSLTTGAPFHAQHGVHLLPDGFAVFDNGDPDGDRLWSRAVAYAVDAEAGTWRETWSYEGDRTVFSAYLGNVEPLADGGTLVNWGGGGRLTRLGPDDDVAWEADARLGTALGFAHVVRTLGGAP